jgi:hypothetical protein
MLLDKTVGYWVLMLKELYLRQKIMRSVVALDSALQVLLLLWASYSI